MQASSGATAHTRFRRTSLALLLTALAVLLAPLGAASAAPAPERAAAVAPAADEEPSNTVQGTLRNTADDGAPVEGVTITATKDGQEYTDTTDADGKFSIEIPGEGGQVTVELDESTLPDGAELREGSTSTRQLVLNPNQTLPISFPIGADTREVSTKWDRVPQLLWNGLLFGVIMAMGALGLSMVFGTTGLTNFAHGELVTFGAVVTYMFNVTLGFPLVLSAIITVVLAFGFGWAQDRGLWRPLRHRGTGLIAMMIVSIGFQFLLRNLFQYFTGGRTLNYADFVTPPGGNFLGLFNYTYRDVALAAVSIVVLVGTTLALNRTRLGRATRAVSDNPALAASTGINVDRVISVVWIMGTALAALSGVFLGYTLGVTFQIGQLVLLLLFAAVVVGGLGSVWGSIIGALIVGVLIELSTLVIPAELKTAGAMLLLIVILMVRPQGLLGRKERIG